jgi:hypothetical protein
MPEFVGILKSWLNPFFPLQAETTIGKEFPALEKQ